MVAQIHPTAVIDPTAEMASDVEVGPYAIVEARAVIGEGCRIGAHVVIGCDTRMGKQNAVYPHAVIGTASQDLKHKGERSFVEIGDGNILREFVTVNRATGEGKATRIGDGCALLAYSHVGHNCVLGDGVVLANCAELGGEVIVEDCAALGGLVGVHQYCRIGAYAYVGACSKVTQDILPFVRADGHPARPKGRNLVGLQRHGFSLDSMRNIKALYRCLFQSGRFWDEALEALRGELGDKPEAQRWIRFIESSTRSIARPRGRSFMGEGEA